MPILWAGKTLGTPLKAKVSGSDLFPNLCDKAAKMGHGVFFLGGREGAARKAASVMRSRYPGLRVVGTYCPPMGFERDASENAKIVRMILNSGADIVFVGLGSPKQEKWIDRFHSQYGASVSIGVGVTFEFVSGMVRRAPLWMQRTGLEWCWRLLMEPGRLWKRYLVDDMAFFWLLLREKMAVRKPS